MGKNKSKVNKTHATTMTIDARHKTGNKPELTGLVLNKWIDSIY